MATIQVLDVSYRGRSVKIPCHLFNSSFPNHFFLGVIRDVSSDYWLIDIPLFFKSAKYHITTTRDWLMPGNSSCDASWEPRPFDPRSFNVSEDYSSSEV